MMEGMKKIGDLAQNAVNAITQTESPIETILLAKMIRDHRFTLVKDGEPQGEGLFVFTQAKVGIYRADMLVKTQTYKTLHRVWPPNAFGTIAVECDGKYHTEPGMVEHDRKRDEYFLSQGVLTVRFTGQQIYSNPSWCIDCIAHEAMKSTGSVW